MGQRQFFVDGEISVEEYHAAFRAFQDCAESAGGWVAEDERNPQTGLIRFSSSSRVQARGARSFDAEGEEIRPVDNPINDCYQEYFDQVQITFELTDDAVQAARPDEAMESFQSIIAPCLEENGIDIPDDLEVGSSEFLELQARFSELAADGRCSDVESVGESP